MLELKHLAGYLPYGLKIEHPTMLIGKRKISELKNLGQTNIEISYRLYVQISECKPILRPLSDLTKEIEVNGDKFIPSKEYNYLRFEEISNYKGGSSTLNFIQVREHNILLELHFDIYGLIDQNLAIDINTLKLC